MGVTSKAMKDNTISSAVNSQGASALNEPKEQEGSESVGLGLKDLALKPTKFYVKKIGLSSYDLLKPREVYKRLGQFNYCGTDYTDDLQEDVGTDKQGNKRIYTGQFKEGTKTWDGIGIAVWSSGDIYEGFWKDDKIHGYGRCIFGGPGNYYIGEWKNGKYEGQGDYHWANGDVYKGQWKNNKREGKGTLTYANGKVKTGQWEDDKFVG